MKWNRIIAGSLYYLAGAIVMVVVISRTAAAELPSIAFYYGDHVPVRQLAYYDRIVVESAHLSAEDLQRLQSRGGRVYAYVSVGEAESWRDGYKSMSPSWFLGRNADWNTDIADLASPQYRAFLLAQRFKPLWDRGLRAFFLDTLDSYQALDSKKVDWPAQQNGLVALVRALKKQYPQSHLLINRGFEVLDRLHGLIDGVAAESLFRGWNQRRERYVQISASDRRWLDEQLCKARDKYGLEVYAIDYVPARERDLARQTARQIAGLGISPWVSVPKLDLLGVGEREFMPRRVLILYDDDTGLDEVEQIAMLLDYYGYIGVYQRSRQPLPAFRLQGRFAGMISLVRSTQPEGYANWLERQVADGVRILMLSDPGVEADSSLLRTFGLAPVASTPPYRVVAHDSWYGFEGRVDQTADPVFELQSIDAHNQVHVKVNGRNGAVLTPVVSGTWGALALDPWSLYSNPPGPAHWIVNPFDLVKTALALPDIPMPDVTTENGQRIWMAHIDGDGLLNRAEMPGTPFAAEVILRRILEKYRYPTTVSVIEGEIGPTGLYPRLSAKAEKVARRIYRLPWVEGASHTYSHPFKWEKIREGAPANSELSLPIKGYRYSLDREIRGSVNFIDANLMPPGKRVKVLLWSGDCLPPEAALRIARQAGLLNMNGGNTTIRDDSPYIFNVSPMTRPVGKELQVYAPIMNEEVYTNLWRGPFYGFRRVIGTFKLTDKPRRLKPIDIYYHFYSGSKTAALRALQTVYDWTLRQQITPMFVSEYLRRVQAYRRTMIFQDLSGVLEYDAPDMLRSLRQVGGACTVDLAADRNVAGYRQLADGTYFALAGGSRTRLKAARPDKQAIRLVRSNGILDNWRQKDGRVSFSMHGHGSLELVVDGPGICRLTVSGKAETGVKTAEGWQFKPAGRRLKGARIVCR